MDDADERYDVVIATVDLARRSGAKDIEVGYLDDDPPYRWYLKANYFGQRLIAEDHETPQAAALAFAQEVFSDGVCQHCEGRTSFNARPDSVPIVPPRMDRAARRRAERAAKRADKFCIWRLDGRRWKRGCERDDEVRGPAGRGVDDGRAESDDVTGP